MKKIIVLTAALITIVLISPGVDAQPPPDYFTGQWKVKIYNTPEGDAEMIVTLERKEDKLAGNIGTEGQEETIEISSIVEKETSITIYFFAAGYDVYMNLDKKDDNNLEGALMDMFTVTGERIEE